MPPPGRAGDVFTWQAIDGMLPEGEEEGQLQAASCGPIL